MSIKPENLKGPALLPGFSDRLWFDLETFNRTPISHGTHAYARTAEILLEPWAMNNGPVQLVDVAGGEPRPAELREALVDPEVELWAHNSQFDRTVLHYQGHPAGRQILRWRDTMIQALQHSLPGALGDLCDVLGVPQDIAKIADGKKLIHLFCKPAGRNRKADRYGRKDKPAEWQRFCEYAVNDVAAMRECADRMPAWNLPDHTLWALDQTINDRGVCIDGALVHAAQREIPRAKADMNARVCALTGGAVPDAQKAAALLDYLAALGVTLPDLQRATLEQALAGELPDDARTLLHLRLESSMASTAKWAALENATCPDGRLRATLQFRGASRTGRWAGRTFQPQNIPRGSLSSDEMETYIDALKSGTLGILL